MENWIVVVDDEAISLKNAKMLLGGGNMRVSLLRSGRDLLTFMENNSPDLILLDIMMPEMDGFETYDALRRLEDSKRMRHIPVIFLTGDRDSETERRGLRAGASDFVCKPFDKDILLERINNTIANSRTIESLTEEATVDQLTGFLNKAGGTKRLVDVCEGRSGSLMILDLDNFKLVNDLFGHDTGDRILEAFSDIVRLNTRDDDVICRIGGDEFMTFLTGVARDSSLISFTKRVNEQLMARAERLMGSDFGIPLGVSTGAVMVPRYGRDYKNLFQLADAALYRSKQNGKHCCCVHSEELLPELLAGDEMVVELARVTQIVEERNESGGALLLGQESFSIAYRFIMRFNARYGGNALRLLIVLSTEAIEDRNLLERTVSAFSDILVKCLRKSDIILQVKLNRFFLLLPELSTEHAPGVVERIKNQWAKTAYARYAAISYTMEPA
ncbi:MAG: diguanylate cyclase [Lachnospiraceae bacterium]|nr:diguanylate cyclase [Lachnospiraceae bacterium]